VFSGNRRVCLRQQPLARTRHAHGHCLSYKTTQQPSSWLLLDYRVRFNICTHRYSRYSQIRTNRELFIQKRSAVIFSIRLDICSSPLFGFYIVYHQRISCQYQLHVLLSENWSLSSQIGFYHLRLFLCVPNISAHLVYGDPVHRIQTLKKHLSITRCCPLAKTTNA
jgi:hypothetical protein